MKKTIAIADADENFCKELETELNKRGSYEVIGTASDGELAVQLVREQQPDMLVLDLLLPQYDGISVLDMISVVHTRCKIFVVTGFISNYIVTALAARRVSELLRKPCPVRYVADRIDEVWQQDNAPLEEKLPDIKQQITAMLHEIGMPAHLKGYHYLRQAIKLAVEDIDHINSVSECIYKPVALLNNTTPERVESSIRRAIEVAWDRGDLDTLQRYFGFTVSNTKGKPTNSEFIALLADKIQLAYSQIL